MGRKYDLPSISTNTALAFSVTRKVDGQVTNLTGWGARFVLARNTKSTPIIDEAGSPEITVDGGAGKISVYLADTVFANFTPGTYVYELYLVDTLGSKRDWIYGEIKIRDGIL